MLNWNPKNSSEIYQKSAELNSVRDTPKTYLFTKYELNWTKPLSPKHINHNFFITLSFKWIFKF